VQLKVKTIAEYETEKAALQKKVVQLQQQLNEQVNHQAEQLEKLRKKYQPQLREAREAIAEQQYRQEQDSIQLQHLVLHKKDLEIKATDEKRVALSQADATIAEMNELLLQAQQQFTEVKEELQKQIKSKEREFDKKLSAIEKEEKEAIKNINEAIKNFQQQYNQQKSELLARRDDELSGKGADTKKIATIEERIQAIKTELEFIEKNRDVVAEYKKDKRELIDKVDDFKTRKTLLEQQYETDEQKHKIQKQQLQLDIENVQTLLEETRQQLLQAEEDAKAFAHLVLQMLMQVLIVFIKKRKMFIKLISDARH
jgi:hypothetical protein